MKKNYTLTIVLLVNLTQLTAQNVYCLCDIIPEGLCVSKSATSFYTTYGGSCQTACFQSEGGVNSVGDDAGYTDGSCSTVLPVELINFSGWMKEGSLLLYWQTISEINNEKFEIEKSQNGREFQNIGEVGGNGTTVKQHNYSFEVKNPRKGISYYRLKQIDFDGQFEYSEVISVNFSGENGGIGEFYPNPSKSGLVNLDYTTQTDEKITVSVFDLTGKLVINQIHQISNGDNNLSFDFSNLNMGIYIVKIGDERNPIHRKLIID